MTNKVLALLPALNQRELREVSAAVDHLLEKGGETNAVYEAILEVTRDKIPFSKFVHTKVGRHWSKHEKRFTRFVDTTWEVTDKVSRHAMMVYLLFLLINDLKKRYVHVSVATLTLNLGEMPRVFDDNFPGYRDNNMAQAVLEAMVQQ